MNSHDKLFLIASAMATLGILNWIAGNRALFGMGMVMRSGAFWIACRWLGLGLFFASAAAGDDRPELLSWIGLVGASAILVGTARKHCISVTNSNPIKK